MTDNRLIIALDFSSLQEVKEIVDKLGPDISFYKVGMELYYSAGEAVVSYLCGLGKKVFLDLKLHDIPNTVCLLYTS
ncbi:MAG: orotidine 5'-phosphate decarboxylase, partial [Negativicutes bacterium]|nr:orotidine 5'-phosphate decarboxylase [Negativicutes bacterium]